MIRDNMLPLMLGVGLFMGFAAAYLGMFIVDEMTDPYEKIRFSGNDLITVMNEPYSDLAVQWKYTPTELREIIDSGEFDYNKLSPVMQTLVDFVDSEP